MVTDSGHGFRLLYYYVDPVEQVRQLKAADFVEIEVFDREGVARDVDSPEVSATAHLHYLARKPVDAAT